MSATTTTTSSHRLVPHEEQLQHAVTHAITSSNICKHTRTSTLRQLSTATTMQDDGGDDGDDDMNDDINYSENEESHVTAAVQKREIASLACTYLGTNCAWNGSAVVALLSSFSASVKSGATMARLARQRQHGRKYTHTHPHMQSHTHACTK
jgi:hypothetical protein